MALFTRRLFRSVSCGNTTQDSDNQPYVERAGSDVRHGPTAAGYRELSAVSETPLALDNIDST